MPSGVPATVSGVIRPASAGLGQRAQQRVSQRVGLAVSVDDVVNLDHCRRTEPGRGDQPALVVRLDPCLWAGAELDDPGVDQGEQLLVPFQLWADDRPVGHPGEATEEPVP